MTRSPLAVTILPLLPLAALAWPLSKVMSKTVSVPPPSVVETPSGPLLPADVSVQSAHPFETLTVTVNKDTWTFTPDDDIQEIQIPEEPKVILTISVTWPEGTPETAVQVLLQADGRDDRSKTLWGTREVIEEIQFTWEDPS